MNTCTAASRAGSTRPRQGRKLPPPWRGWFAHTLFYDISPGCAHSREKQGKELRLTSSGGGWLATTFYEFRQAVHAYEITTQFGARVHGRGLGSLPVVGGGVATPFLRLRKYGRGREINGSLASFRGRVKGQVPLGQLSWEYETTAGASAPFQWKGRCHPPLHYDLPSGCTRPQD